MKKNKAPIELKKEIISFCREYERLSHQRLLTISIPSYKGKLQIEWNSDDTIYIDEYSLDQIKDKLDRVINDSEEIREINRRIKDFCNRTESFGLKYFGDKFWLWDVILWSYNPELGEVFKLSDIEWAKNIKDCS